VIYFLQDHDGGPVKIGCSDDVDTRHRQLEAHYGRPLALLAAMEGGPEEEAEIHRRFAHIRLNGRGKAGRRPEQFRPAAELMTFLGRPLLVGANPDTVEAMPGRVSGDKPVRVELTDDVHRMLRKLAADEGVSMASFARETMERVVREEFKKRGLK
jgi:hypothetical protein